MPFAFILTKQIGSFSDATQNKDYTRREVEDAIKILVQMIPESWVRNDEEWHKDVDAATSKIKIDVRPKFAGVKILKEICEQRGIPVEQEVEVIDYFKLLHAVFNKLNRLGMITRKEWTESPTGMPKGEEALPEDMNLQEYIASLEEETDEIQS